MNVFYLRGIFVFSLPSGCILMLNLYEYWKALSETEKNRFCESVGVSYGYMESHLIHGRKKPRMETIQAIVDASNNKLSHKNLFEFFLKKSPSAA